MMKASKRDILQHLGVDVLRHLAERADAPVADRRRVGDLIDGIMRRRSYTIGHVIADLKVSELKLVCQVLGVNASGRREELEARILGEPADEPQAHGSNQSGNPPHVDDEQCEVPIVSRAETSLGVILEQFREDARSNRDLGDRFERLILRYLELDPIYAERFSKVWMWNDWPDKGRVGDVGVDLVAQERSTGEYCAIQCKFYLPEHTLSKADIDSFLAALGKPAFTSGLIVSTTDRWGKNALDALKQSKHIQRLSEHQLDASPIDWSKFDARRLDALTLREKKSLRQHQQKALDDVVNGFKEADRGKLVMACGTGKTFTALRIAETLAPRGHVLFLVPSLSLLSQSLREWTSEATNPLQCLAVCSDAKIGRSRRRVTEDAGDIDISDLEAPATTNAAEINRQYTARQSRSKPGRAGDRMTVVFSTYHSIEAVSKAQKKGLPDFDLVICDEAHRTTGVTLSGDDESHFVKIHDKKFIRAGKRLYMTATPRIYGDEAQRRAADAEAELCSMDDVDKFGEEFHRLGFGEAVGKQLLTDYKVLILAVDEKYVSKAFQRQLASNSELTLPDAVKITGCWNGLAKRLNADSSVEGDPDVMRRAVAFSRTIADSKRFVKDFGDIMRAYREMHPEDEPLHCELDHVDGSYDAMRRNALLEWLKAETPDNTCRILSNARCLSEGVDVPALDAVLFLNPRNSVIDVVQSVGRVMRRAEGKQYGYIILPIGIPADMEPEEALKDNDKYRIVWQVLQALRAHDDRFNATINQLELNRERPDNIDIIGVGGGDEDTSSDGDSTPTVRHVQSTFAFPDLDEWKDAIYARIVLKCGDRRYWESWAKDVAVIAERHSTRIRALLESDDPKQAKAFAQFLKGLRANINPAVTEDEAIEMLSQHLITKPVFDALFENFAFTEHNPVSKAMQKMLESLHDEGLEKETERLQKFYDSVHERASGIDNAEGRQRVVIELYDKFFRTAFPRMADRLGIVYTPVEVVDFIIRSVEDVLRDEFDSALKNEDVHVIDPFTGTGTFIARLIQSGLIPPEELARKYAGELHANEIVLLAYYIAAVNIEHAYHALRGEHGSSEYEPFEGIVLTDTFQLYESKGELADHAFPENNKRVRRQKAAPIRVVIANPPYSAQQTSANDNNQNLSYSMLDARIGSTYAARSNAKLKKNLYDSYVRAIRWASDRIADRGVIGIVTNGSFIDANNMDGLRACLATEFTSVYVFNLRGNQRTSGELSRREGGKIFGSGSRTPVAITVLVRNPEKLGSTRIHYRDIGDYLSREDKLQIVSDYGSIASVTRCDGWTQIEPNDDHDWVNQRDPSFEKFIPVLARSSADSIHIFNDQSMGANTSRDAWVYNYSQSKGLSNARAMVKCYRDQLGTIATAIEGLPADRKPAAMEGVIDADPKRISWSADLKRNALRGRRISVANDAMRVSLYRPYCKQYLAFEPGIIERPGRLGVLFPKDGLSAVAICISGLGSSKEFSALMTNVPPNFNMLDACRVLPLHAFDASIEEDGMLAFKKATSTSDRVTSAIADAACREFESTLRAKIKPADLFHYVYGVFHSQEYRTRFAANLRKEIPRVPVPSTMQIFEGFVEAGRELGRLHAEYETVEPYELQEHSDVLALDPDKHFRVEKMTWGRKAKAIDRSTIVFNTHITLGGIPPEAHEYVVNGKPAIEWVMERYQITRDKASGIRNDPNDWATEHGNPRYILDLVKRVVRVSVETVRIVKSLPALNERT